VSLSTQPASNVVVSVSSANALEVAVASSAFITFTPFDSTVPQFVVVRGVDDLARDGDRKVHVTVSVVNVFSADAYRGESERLEVQNVDDEPRGGRGGGDDDDDDDDENGGG
jgi:hypothetical protein